VMCKRPKKTQCCKKGKSSEFFNIRWYWK